MIDKGCIDVLVSTDLPLELSGGLQDYTLGHISDTDNWVDEMDDTLWDALDESKRIYRVEILVSDVTGGWGTER